MHSRLAVTVVVGGVLGWVAASDGCASFPSGDCTSNGTCPPPSDDGGDAPQSDVALEGDARDAAVDARVDAGPDAGPNQSGDGSLDAPGDAADGFDGFVCDPMKSPHDEACVIDEAYGVFVSTSGHDVATGTMADPLKTIAEGVAKAAQIGKAHVYVCDGIYTEQVTLSSPVNLYGGLACAAGDAGWSYADGGRGQVIGLPSQVTLTIRGVAGAMASEDLNISAPNATGKTRKAMASRAP